MRGYGSGGSASLRVATSDLKRVHIREFRDCEEDQVTISGVPVALSTTRPNYGGCRLWFLCPLCGVRRVALYVRREGLVGCRECFQLAYPSKYERREVRLFRRIHKLLRQLGTESSGGDTSIPPRPKGMHRQTYARILRELDRCGEKALENFHEEHMPADLRAKASGKL